MNSSLIIREAVLADAEEICTVNRDSLGYDFPLESVRERLSCILNSPRYKVLVAEHNGKVIGCIQGADHDGLYFEPMKDVVGLAVLDEAKGLGAGRKLLEAVEQWAKNCGCAGVRLESGMERLPAHAFYEHCGYARGKDHKRYTKFF